VIDRRTKSGEGKKTENGAMLTTPKVMSSRRGRNCSDDLQRMGGTYQLRKKGKGPASSSQHKGRVQCVRGEEETSIVERNGGTPGRPGEPETSFRAFNWCVAPPSGSKKENLAR